MIEEQLKAQIHLYPSVYPELFCVSVAESEVAGAYPITTAEGALATTNMGEVINADAANHMNDRLFIDKTIKLLSDQEKLKSLQDEVKLKAIERFSPDTILRQWSEKVFNDG